MNKKILKSFIWMIGISGGLIPFTFNFTSPEHLPWLFLGDIGIFIGVTIIAFCYLFSKAIDVYLT